MNSKQTRQSALELDLEAIRSTWQGLRRDEPPELLDQSLRNAARRQLESRKRQRSLRWLGSLATAAVIVLALAIVVQQDQQGPVPPTATTDGFRLDQAVTAEKSVSDEAAQKQEPARAEPGLQRAAPAAASEGLPAINGSTAPMAPEEADADLAPPSPEEWIERMRQLRQTGRQQELRAQLQAFREAWPDHPLPPDLQE